MSEIIFDTPMALGKSKTRWSHLVADNIDELHEFAQKIGLKREWFQISASGIPHYDISSSRIRALAISLGAKQVDRKTLHTKATTWQIKKA